ncbi:MAG: hypothetical protein SWH78_16940 [Thermodesulfobacteriota bacterium]|nr:hypothetical protein [Thermodesulfobacteriota bacterium]
METNKLYTIVTGAEGKEASPKAEPSEYFLKLPPQEAIAALQAHLKSLEDRLAEFSKIDLKIPENLEKAREVSFELEIAEEFLRRFKKAHGTSD